LVCVT